MEATTPPAARNNHTAPTPRGKSDPDARQLHTDSFSLAPNKQPLIIDNPLLRYKQHIESALTELERKRRPESEPMFTPRSGLPATDDRLSKFFSPSEISIHTFTYKGRNLTLLNLMRNSRTRTTKTFASLTIVARAVAHIQQTGENLMIVTPSSGNKVTALRDAVLWAIQLNLVSPERLRILSIVPSSSRKKLWSSLLDRDEALSQMNPIASHAGRNPGDVKSVAHQLVDRYAEEFWQKHGIRLWHTMNIDNYKTADLIRAHVENEYLPTPIEPRLHVHAVSSAFGLLGYELGARQLEQSFGPSATARYFLVQHLGTPDMVLNLHFGSPDLENMPEYNFDMPTGLYRQETDPRFPLATYQVNEVLDSTFYTRRPTTSAEMDRLIRERGGGGIVVSLHECLVRYGQVRAALQQSDIRLPADPRELCEWSLIMAITGILNAIDRGIVNEKDIVIHGTGSYQISDFESVPTEKIQAVTQIEDLANIARRAASVQVVGQ